MQELRYTLLSDGSSDRALLPILTWLLKTHLRNYSIQPQWADLRRTNSYLRDTLQKRIKLSIELYPSELLFIHRDAENQSTETRITEINSALVQLKNVMDIPTVHVIPIRMTEAWLLFDITAIRKAASNPHGKMLLQLPNIKIIEKEPDPKKLLHDILYHASGLSSKRLKSFSVHERVHRLADLIDDFTYLKNLSAFQALDTEVMNTIKQQGW